MALKIVFSLAFLISACFAHEFSIQNKCAYTVWFATMGNPGKGNPENGGFELAHGATHKFNVSMGWAGRLWGKTQCDASGHHCATGDGPVPATLAEFTFGDATHVDFYDVSLVDGYNLAMRIVPIAGTFKKTGNNKYDCNPAGCKADLNAHCPDELAVKHNGSIVACKSACATFKTDEYCCGGAHNKPETCKSSDWPKNYPAIFKTACPDAYSYAYDDNSSTFTCHGNPVSGYEIIFCP